MLQDHTDNLTPPAQNSFHVLVLESDRRILLLTEGQLKRLGFGYVTAVSTANLALGVLANARVDVALLGLDHDSRGPSIEIAKWLQDRAVPFVFATSYDRRPVPYQISCDGFVPSPTSDDVLEQALFGALGLSNPVAEGSVRRLPITPWRRRVVDCS